jgi:23S rRNA (adenine2503-C2)-methyltransferase
MEQKRALTEVSKEELQTLVAAWGQPRYRADQIWRWLYVNLVSDPGEMTNLPQELRARLAEEFVISSVRPLRTLRSQDGRTEKVLLALADGQTIETVLMSYEGRQTVCVSSQVGCAVRCAFCATGVGGWQRNLTAGEIVDQVLYYARQLKPLGETVSNLVYMGMGEPFLNMDAVLRSISVLNDPAGMNLGARRITLSTVGIVPGIERLAQEAPAVGLAVSLHAPTDELRNQLVPVNRRYPLEVLIKACRDYVQKTRRRVTFEYAMIDGVNDAPAQADALANLLRGLLCHVNLIPMNPVPDLPYRPSPRERILAFEARLRQRGINATLRLSRGADIQAGCGQLRSAPVECQTIVNT